MWILDIGPKHLPCWYHCVPNSNLNCWTGSVSSLLQIRAWKSLNLQLTESPCAFMATYTRYCCGKVALSSWHRCSGGYLVHNKKEMQPLLAGWVQHLASLLILVWERTTSFANVNEPPKYQTDSQWMQPCPLAFQHNTKIILQLCVCVSLTPALDTERAFLQGDFQPQAL